MFAPTYHLKPVKGDVVKLSPTLETWMKYAIVPNLLVFGGIAVLCAVADRQEKKLKAEIDKVDTETK